MIMVYGELSGLSGLAGIGVKRVVRYRHAVALWCNG